MNFSEREKGFPLREQEQLSDRAWNGLISLVDNLIEKNYFGESFPYICGNCGRNGGSDNIRLNSALYSEIGIEDGNWLSFKSYCLDESSRKNYCLDKNITLNELCWIALDLIEFCFENCATPNPKNSSTGCYRHGGKEYERYDSNFFKEEWRDKINKLFKKNGLAYELNEHGKVVRLLDPVFEKDFSYLIKTGNVELDKLLQEAKDKFLHPKFEDRVDSIRDLWFAWERLKTLEGQKQQSIKKLLLRISKSENDLFKFLDEEGKRLTDIGNGKYGNFIIRHSECDKFFIDDKNLLDYLFQRLFSLVMLIIKNREQDYHEIDSLS